MRLRVLSDLHVEFSEFEPCMVESDVVVLAGDIGVGTEALDWVHDNFSDIPVVYVLGNHEYYGHDLDLATELRRRARRNVHILDNDTIVIDGVRFVGSTLWTDFALFGQSEQFFAIQHAARGMPDFDVIRQRGTRFTPQSSLTLFQQNKAWLIEKLAAPYAGPTAVVTHHAPSLMSVATRFKTDPMSPAFASRLEAIIEAHRPDVWIHGHTHDTFDYVLFDTRIVCNPRGYPEEAGRNGFDPRLVVELG